MTTTADTNTILEEQPEKKGDLGSMFSSLFSKIPIKMAFLLFIIFVLINSTVFIEYCVEPFGKNYFDGINVTSTGTYLQGLFLSVAYIILATLDNYNII
jgi:hypothetical protein